jgi:hypothetical protein
VVSLYEKERYSKDSALLSQLIYFPPNTSEQVKKETVKKTQACADEKALRIYLSAKPEYEKVLDEKTAEVGVVLSGLGAIRGRIPVQQYILKKDGGAWKIYCNRYEPSEQQLLADFEQNPQDYSILYLMASHVLPDNPPKAHQFFLKYYELDPKGFWVCDEFVQEITKYKKEFNLTEIYETELLIEIKLMDAKRYASRAIKYTQLGQLFAIKGEYGKAEEYFTKAESEFKGDPDLLGKEMLQKSRQELQLRKEGKYKDILDMIPPK